VTRPAPNAPPGTIPELEDLEDLFENAPCGYVSMGADGRITRANRTFEAWTGWERSDLLGKKFQDLLNIAGKIYFETHFAPLLRMQGFFNEVALDVVRQDGSTLPVLVNAVERRGPAGELNFIRITIFNASDRRRYERQLMEARRAAEKTGADLQDLNAHLEVRVAEAIEERLKAEAALRQAQKLEAVGQLTGGIAHDFNNMMAVVLSGLSLIERRLARGDTDVAPWIAAAREGADRAVALTQRLLAFSRQQALSPRPLAANRLIADMSDLLRRTLGEGVRLETRLAPDLWFVHADANQLENAIINLAVNARDAMPDGGHLTIETMNVDLDERGAAEVEAIAGEHVMLAVTDTGAGMSPETASRAFEPFFTTKGAGKGTGLGLSQVFGFVKQSGGHVSISSVPGQGTCVKVILPRFQGILSEEDPEAVLEAIPAGRSEVILLVEDDVQVRHLFEAMLRDFGYVVLSAANGVDALALLGIRSDVRLMLTDVVMPGMNGQQVAEVARRRHPDLKVIYMTGYSREAIEADDLSDPDVMLLSKPITPERLAGSVRTALDR
jgi:PAS domain S-box-containing protein